MNPPPSATLRLACTERLEIWVRRRLDHYLIQIEIPNPLSANTNSLGVTTATKIMTCGPSARQVVPANFRIRFLAGSIFWIHKVFVSFGFSSKQVFVSLDQQGFRSIFWIHKVVVHIVFAIAARAPATGRAPREPTPTHPTPDTTMNDDVRQKYSVVSSNGFD